MGFSNTDIGLLTFYITVIIFALLTEASIRISRSSRRRRTNKAK